MSTTYTGQTDQDRVFSRLPGTNMELLWAFEVENGHRALSCFEFYSRLSLPASLNRHLAASNLSGPQHCIIWPHSSDFRLGHKIPRLK